MTRKTKIQLALMWVATSLATFALGIYVASQMIGDHLTK